MSISSDAKKALREAEAYLVEVAPEPGSLSPSRAIATTASELVERARATSVASDEVIEAFALGIARIVRAQARHFPETIFWDLDAMAFGILTGPASESVDQMTRLCDEIAALQAQYGKGSVLAFRYLHDFTYGYDWVKWIRRDPSARKGVRPFSPQFVNYLRRRGDELVELIARDDEKYPKLPNGMPRNPFGFSREPAHESKLFEAMASDDLLPVRGWRPELAVFVDRPFAELREERAIELGIPNVSHGDA